MLFHEIRKGINHIVILKKVLNIIVITGVVSVHSKNIIGTVAADLCEELAQI